LGPQQEQPLTVLRHSVASRVEHLSRRANDIARRFEGNYQLGQERLVAADRQPLDVFEHEASGIEFGHEADKLANQQIAGIVERTVADQREPLARRASEYAIDAPIPDAGALTDVGCRYLSDRPREDSAL